MVEGLSEETMKDGKFFLLHPILHGNYVQFKQQSYDVNWWSVQNLSEDFYDDIEDSVIVLIKSK